MPEGDPPASPGPELQEAITELELALDALRRARSMWHGARPWSGGKTWDLTAARRALEEAESRLGAARTRLSAALETAQRSELGNSAQG